MKEKGEARKGLLLSPKIFQQREGDRLLDVREAASLLSLKTSTLYRWAYERRIPVVKLGSLRGALRFRLSDLNALVARSVRPALESALDAI